MTASTLSLERVAALVEGRLHGPGSARIRDVAPLLDAGPDELGLLSDRRYVGAVERSRAGAFLVSDELADAIPADRPRIVVADARKALGPLLARLHPEREVRPGIHPTAILGEGCSLGADIAIGPYAIVGDRVVLADRARVDAHTVLGDDVRIGEAAVLHAHVVLYAGVVVGRRAIVHAGARIGADGFGYTMVDGEYAKVPQVGRVVIGDDVEIGANSCIDRGSIGDTVVGRGTKIDNLVQIGHNVHVGEDSALAAQVGVAGSTRMGRGVVLGGQAGVIGHVEIGDGVQVAGQAGVLSDVEPGGRLAGYPARNASTYLKAATYLMRLPELFSRVRDLTKRVDALDPETSHRESDTPGAPEG